MILFTLSDGKWSIGRQFDDVSLDFSSFHIDDVELKNNMHIVIISKQSTLGTSLFFFRSILFYQSAPSIPFPFPAPSRLAR